MVSFRYISVNTLHDGDDDDDNSVICAMNSDYRIPETLYTLQAWFVSEI
jgi:hypothetical protein